MPSRRQCLISRYRYVWSAAEMQAKNEEWQMVCANVFGLEWSQRLRAMSAGSRPYKLDGLEATFTGIRFRERGRDPLPSFFSPANRTKKSFLKQGF